MDTPTFAANFTALITQERGRIHESIKAAKAKRQEADREVAQLEAQLAAIAAYESALKGTRVPKAAASSTGRGRPGKKREAVLALIGEHPEGLSRGEILTAMDAHGDKAAEMSVSNVLAALKRTGRVVQEDKAYKVLQRASGATAREGSSAT